MTHFLKIGLIVLFMTNHAHADWHTPKPLSTHATWKDSRDSKITKQDVDYSCGASSLSTILTYFYQHPKTEQQILDDMALDDVMASFADLASVSEKYGYTAYGMTMDYDTLAKIKIPAIVYVNHKRSDHFSVIRAIDKQNVYLSDSSWGNRTLTRNNLKSCGLPPTITHQARCCSYCPSLITKNR